MRDSAPRCLARRSFPQCHEARARLSCARSDTRRPPTSACGRPATRPPIRSRPSSTDSCPPARRAESSVGGRTAVVRPLLDIWREDTAAYCVEHGLDYRSDSSNAASKRGLIRHEILPLLRRLHPGAEQNLLALADERPRLPRELERTLIDLLASTDGAKSADLGSGVRAVREYDEVRLEGRVTFGPWRIESARPGLTVRTRRPGDRLAGRTKKIQDVFVDAKVPRSARDAWPIVVSGNEVVAVPGLAVAPGWEDTVRAWKDCGT